MRLVMLAAAVLSPANSRRPPGRHRRTRRSCRSGCSGIARMVRHPRWPTRPSLRSRRWTYLNASGRDRCQMGAGSKGRPLPATDAWRFSGKVREPYPRGGRAAARLATGARRWQRSRLARRIATVHAQKWRPRAARLRDAIGAPPCWSSVGFEVRYMASPMGGTGRSDEESRVADGPHPRGGGAGSGGAIPVSGRARHPVSGGGGGRREWLAAGPNFDVSLWLVRSVAGKQDEVWHQTLRTGHDETAFAFAPVTVETARRSRRAAGHGPWAGSNSVAGPQLQFETKRRVTYPVTGTPPRDGGQDTQGSSRTTIPLPGPEEVLSFQLPPLPGGVTAPKYRISCQCGSGLRRDEASALTDDEHQAGGQASFVVANPSRTLETVDERRHFVPGVREDQIDSRRSDVRHEVPADSFIQAHTLVLFQMTTGTSSTAGSESADSSRALAPFP